MDIFAKFFEKMRVTSWPSGYFTLKDAEGREEASEWLMNLLVRLEEYCNESTGQTLSEVILQSHKKDKGT